MPMAIELPRRRMLLGAAACVALPAWPRTAAAPLFAAWDATDRGAGSHRIGLLDLSAATVRVRASQDVPTRAHGLAVEPEGTLLALARRPGDWLVRWRPTGGKALWHWNSGGRTFNGHVERRGDAIFTTETDHESGRGVIVLRDAASLRERAVWPTHGRDPHDFLFDGEGALWVANGGIGADAATGRVKDTRAMDASLVRLNARSGALLGQWRLADRKLSLRHLALAGDGRIGIALQAEHDDAANRAAAPLLALWQDGVLRPVPGPAAAGYGGDIATLGDGFVISAPRSGRLLAWRESAGWRTTGMPDEPCALAASASRLWCGGRQRLWSIDSGFDDAHSSTAPQGMRVDNHAVILT